MMDDFTEVLQFDGTLSNLIEVLTTIQQVMTRCPIYATDAHGNISTRVRITTRQLTDGSYVHDAAIMGIGEGNNGRR